MYTASINHTFGRLFILTRVVNNLCSEFVMFCPLRPKRFLANDIRLASESERTKSYTTYNNNNNNKNNNNNNNNNNKHAFAGTTDSFTHLRVLLVLADRGILA